MNITNTTNKTLVNGSENFTYTIDATFAAASKAEIRILMPTRIKYELPPITGILKSIDVLEQENGDFLIFNFGLVNEGEQVEFNILAHFDVGRVQGDSFICSAGIYLDDVFGMTATAQAVNLTLNENFRLQKYIIGDKVLNPGDTVTYRITLINSGDYGAKIDNILIVDTLPTGLRYDSTFEPKGKDGSIKFVDKHLDGLSGILNSNTLTFNLDSFCGESYVIEYKAVLDDNLEPGTQLVNKVELSVDSIKRDEKSALVKIFEDSVNASLVLKTQEELIAGLDIYNGIEFNNKSTVFLDEVEVIYNMPESIILKRFEFSFPNQASDACSLFIKTNLRDYFLLLENAFGDNNLGDLSDYLNEGEYLTNIKVKIDNYKIGYLNGIIQLFSVVKDDITNNFEVSASLYGRCAIDEVNRNVIKTVRIEDRTSLNLKSDILNKKSVYYPTDILNINLKSSCPKAFYRNPVYAIMLPSQLKYVFGNEYYKYYDFYKDLNYDSRDGTFPFEVPEIEVIENYNNTGFTLLRFKFNDTIISCFNELNLYFDLAVAIGATNSFDLVSFMGDPSSDAHVRYSPLFYDVDDFDGDSITNEAIARNVIENNNILYTRGFNIENLVKGNGDDTYTTTGSTTKDGKVSYKIAITNNQNATLENFEIIDILPCINDTNVLNENPRGSQFNVNLRKEISTKVVNMLTKEVRNIDNIIYHYSTSSNPIRYDSLNQPIGNGLWTTDMPADLSTIKSIKIATPLGFELHPYECLFATLNCITPNNISNGIVAYNSYVVKADVISDDTTLKLLPIEPLKNSLTIISPKYSGISSYVWYDENGDGLFNNNEGGLDEITIELYDEDFNLIRSRLSTNKDNPGNYAFNSLIPDNYYLKFINNEDYILTKQIKDKQIGSKPDPITMLTDKIELKPNTIFSNANAGFISVKKPIITAYDKFVDLYSKFNPLDDVSAVDSVGNDITNNIIVLVNEVDTSIVGRYNVTYSVTDSYNKTTTLSIVVEVKDILTRCEAITDIINSIGLEETAITNIIDNEAKKIEKALELGCSSEQLLKINDSVTSMINAINNLENIITAKLVLFKDCNCKIK